MAPMANAVSVERLDTAALRSYYPAKQGRVLSKVRVLGPIGELSRWCAKYGVRKVIIALPRPRTWCAVASPSSARARASRRSPCRRTKTSSTAGSSSPRSAASSSTTCSGRDPVVLDSAGLGEWLGNRVVMVTGAGGSIGAELCRQIARFQSGAARAVRPVGGRALRDPARARRRVPAAAAVAGGRRRQARRARRATCSPASSRRSSSMRRPTSTCR